MKHDHILRPSLPSDTRPSGARAPSASVASKALVQIPMVSKATGIAPSALRALISRETNSAVLGFMGSSYIDVLQLNEALAQPR